MHRFRKKSDIKRSQVPDSARASPAPLQEPSETLQLPEIKPLELPGLPPESDFRTSLILPDLSRRFSLLRTSSGAPLTVEQLKSRFAEQRARGSENYITEEEEDMLLETLGRLRSKHVTTSSDNDGDTSADSSGYYASPSDDTGSTVTGRHSVRSTNTAASSIRSSQPSSPYTGGRPNKRYSNNLFGSGRLRDASAIRSSQKGPISPGARNGLFPVLPPEGSESVKTRTRAISNSSTYSDAPRPSTPEDSSSTYTPSNSVDSSPLGPAARSAPLIAPAPYASAERPSSPPRHRRSSSAPRAMTPKELYRMSVALEDVIREMEEEAEDEIVMPRSPPSRGLGNQNGNGSAITDKKVHDSSTASEQDMPATTATATATALSSDRRIALPDSQRNSPVPPYSRSGATSPRLPGYIPGMPRPMTPRGGELFTDTEDQGRSHSTTPRATSPMTSGVGDRPPIVPPTLPPLNFGHVRRDSNASTSSGRLPPRVGSPLANSALFTSRAVNGRFTPDNKAKEGGDDSFFEPMQSPVEPSSSSINRPMSPPSSVSQRYATSSRPGTPSNIRWNTTGGVSTVQKTHSRHGSSSGHSRNESSASGTDTNGDGHGGLDRSNTMTSSIRAPALPDSPILDSGHASMTSVAMGRSTGFDNRPPSAASNAEISSPISLPRSLMRSPTPTQNRTRSPTSPSFPDTEPNTTSTVHARHRSSTASPFSLGLSQPLIFSPIANSSHSSLESDGSSYHSWNEESKADNLSLLIKGMEMEQAAPWHDLSSSRDKSRSPTLAESFDDEERELAEDVVRQSSGLTNADFAAIQDKLVKAVVTKAAAAADSRPPSLRKRRPSTTSQTVLSGMESRATSPPPQAQATSATAVSPDNRSKASALLDSVIDSIQSPHTNADVGASDPGVSDVTFPGHVESLPSSPIRRKKDLDDALFGPQGRDRPMLSPEPTPVIDGRLQSPDMHDHTAVITMTELASPSNDSSPQRQDDAQSIPYLKSPSHSQSNLLSPKSPQYLTDPEELEREVKRRATEATAALRKPPSNHNIREARKRINPNQISSPHLVLSSTSVDTVPLGSPSLPSQAPGPGPSKLGSRFKKLKGTLRTKPATPTGEEITPFPMDLKPVQPPQQEMLFDPGTSGFTQYSGIQDVSGSKPSLNSPPMSAGPGLKGFMARFRKARNADLSPEQERRAPLPRSGLSATTPPTLAPSDDRYPYQHIQSAPPFNTNFPEGFDASNSTQSSSPRAAGPENPGTPSDEVALKQLFDAASNLGLDQAALSNLVRSTSTSNSSRTPSWNLLSRNNSRSAKSRNRAPSQQGASMDRTRSSTFSEGRPSVDGFSNQTREAPPRKSSVHSTLTVSKSGEVSGRSRSQTEDSPNRIVRRTIIVPSDTRVSTIDFNSLVRKNSQSTKKRRPTSTMSGQSNRSVHERVPTPPPARATGRRFSTDSSPPVPQLPPSVAIAQADSALPLLRPAGQLEKSSSAHESLYEMYAEEGKIANGTASEPRDLEPPHPLSPHSDMPGGPDSGPALELIELANGETIWSIVNGLRDDDAESFYTRRASFVSEYSVYDSKDDGMQVFFKEHARKSSKGSNTSFLSPRKSSVGNPSVGQRPETKVFYSSPTQIGRLIEDLSLGMDAGSFNFMPHRLPGGSSAGEPNWTVEEV